uniref:Nuclear receptor domain-containing protein n=1 Tax=Steinernema glaseri TaxID=37863 RepID=A0A1I7YRJ8_9BILA
MRAALCQYCVPKDDRRTVGFAFQGEQRRRRKTERSSPPPTSPMEESSNIVAAANVLLLAQQPVLSVLSVASSASGSSSAESSVANGDLQPMTPFDVGDALGNIDSPATEGKGLCRVCGAKSHGAHFQVQTCRACAAFFRRTCAGGRTYKCRRATKSCDVAKNAQLNCRYCRFERCRKVGMKYHKSQDEVPSDVPQTSVDLASIKQEVVTPSPADPAPSTATFHYDNHRVLMDIDRIHRSVASILEGNVINFGPSPGASAFRVVCHSTLDRVKHAFDELFAAEWAEKRERHPVTKVDIKRILNRLSVNYMKYAKFLMATPHFAKLDMQDKWLMYRRANSLFVLFDTAYPTIKTFGYDVNDRKIIFDAETCSNVDNFEFCAEGMPESTQREVNKVFMKFPRDVIENLVTPMRKMRMTDWELVYLQMLLLWDIRTIPEVSDNAREVAARVVDEVSAEMDRYYRNELRMSTYATRIVKLCTVQGEMMKYAATKKSAHQMGELFDTFYCDLYGPKFVTRG